MNIDHSEVLKKNGLKTTNARITILEYLQKVKKPVDVAEIIHNLNKQSVNVDQATVYRIINTFVKNGILHRIEFLEGKFRYEISSLPHHHHAICTNCGVIEDIENCETKKLEITLKKKSAFQVRFHHLEFFGLCSHCQ